MAAINDLINQIENPALRDRIQKEIERMNKQSKFGLVFEEHLPESVRLYDIPVTKGLTVVEKNGEERLLKVSSIKEGIAECVDLTSQEIKVYPLSDIVPIALFGTPIYPFLKPIDSICNAPDSDLWHSLIEADNYHALQLLVYLYAGKVDCIYIDPPYNTGARDWKYNNNYVDGADEYRHSKWLSFMQKRLALAKKLLNPKDSVLIVTIDEKEYLHLGCLLEQMFPEANIQMVSSVINSKGVARGEFFRVNEYLFFVRLGSCTASKLALPDEWEGNVKTSTTKSVRWGSLMRSGSNSERRHSPGCFYPILVSSDKKHFCGAGDPLPKDADVKSYSPPEGTIALFPIHQDGTEGVWQYSKSRFLEIQKKGYARISTQTKSGLTIRYISDGWQKKVENGQVKVLGKAEDGSLLFDDEDYVKVFIPNNQWWIPTHDATEFGSKLLQKIIGKRFSYPKSLYAVHDAIRFFVAEKKNALIVDFFAGSGTTLHAVNLLNAEDGGHRRCIMVTNNEVSVEEATSLRNNGFQPGDEEWERLGIARYANWPRTVCSIKGVDIQGNPLQGNYFSNEEIPMANGFKANAIFFKLGFLDNKSIKLGRKFDDLLPLLWMKAGAVGPCPELMSDTLPDWLILPENKMALLIDDNQYHAFKKEMETVDGINTLYILTDFEREYIIMAGELGIPNTYQLYRDYLDYFRINYNR